MFFFRARLAIVLFIVVVAFLLSVYFSCLAIVFFIVEVVIRILESFGVIICA